MAVSKFALLLLILKGFCIAQDKPPYDRDTLLRDTSYVFNRFEELATGVTSEIDTYPPEIRKNTRQALSAVLRNVNNEKPALNALLGRSNVSTADLFDAYAELGEVAAELDGESTNSLNWGDQKLGLDLAQLSSKASVLGAKLGVTLRTQIVAQESQLAFCVSTKSAAKAATSHK